MNKNRKSTSRAFVTTLVVLTVCLVIITGSTFSLFTSKSGVNIAVTSGKVNMFAEIDADSLALYSKDVPQQNGKFENGGTAAFAEENTSLALTNITPGDKATFKIKVTNNSNVDIQYRLNWVVEGKLAEALVASVDGVELASSTSEWTPWKAADTQKTKTIEVSIALPLSVVNQYQDMSAYVDFIVEAVQANATGEYSKVAYISTPAGLQAAIDAGCTEIILNNDLELTSGIVVPEAATTYSLKPTYVLLDLNGKSVSGEIAKADGPVIKNNGNLIIKNGTVTSAADNGGSVLVNNGTAILENVTFNAPKIVDGGWPSYAVNNNGNLTIESAVINSYHGAVATGGDGVTVIKYAEIDVGQKSQTKQTSWALYAYENGQVTVYDGIFANTKNEYNKVYGGGYICTSSTKPFVVYGGIFDKSEVDNNGTGFYYNNLNLELRGGTYDADPTKSVAEGFKAAKAGDIWLVVPESYAAIAYDEASLSSALTAGGEILVVNNIEVDADNTINVTAKAVLDLNGYTVSGVSDQTGANRTLINVTGSGDLTIKNGKVTLKHVGDNMGWNNSTNVLEAVFGAKLTIDNVDVINLGGSDMAYAVNVGNNGGATFKAIASNIESKDYTAVRVFNNANGAIDIEFSDGCTLTSNSAPFFVHFWTEDDLGTKQAERQSYLTLDLGDTAVSRYSGSKSLLRFGFTNAIYYSGIDMTEVVAANEVALKWALANGKNVLLNNDITLAASKGGYNLAGIVVNGQTLDGNGNTLTVTGANSTWDCGIYITGGTVKNLTVSEAFRGIFTGGANSDIYIENVTFNNVVYTFNSDGGSTEYGVYLKNCKVNGWTSFSDVHKEVVFTDCTFAEGSGNAFCRPYNACQFVNCVFEEGFLFDVSKSSDISFTGCYYGETLITLDNAASLALFYNGIGSVKFN